MSQKNESKAVTVPADIEPYTGSPYKKEKVAVNQFGLDGKYIQSFVSMWAAYKKTGVRVSSISSCCRGKCKSAGGFQWRKA